MRLVDILADVESISTLSGQRNLLRRAVQAKLFEYAASRDWPHYRDIGVITTYDDYTTGTIAVTNGSVTVTGTSTVWTRAMVGRKLRVGTSNQFYFIDTFTSATSIGLRTPYQAATATAQSYTLFQDEYKLDANTHKLLDLRQMQDSLMMIGLSYLDMDRWFPDPDTLNDPTYFAIIGRRDDRYTTGTIAVTANSRTLTGTSTTWSTVDGFTRGSRISITDTAEVFTVDTVDSDTSLTVYELPTIGDTSSAYRIFLNNIIVKVQDVPNETRLLYYRKQRLPYPLYNNEDEPDLPREYHYGLVWGGLQVAFNLLGRDQAATEAERRWNSWIALQVQQIGIDSPAIDYSRKSVDRFVGLVGSPYGRLPTNYGYALWP